MHKGKYMSDSVPKSVQWLERANEGLRAKNDALSMELGNTKLLVTSLKEQLGMHVEHKVTLTEQREALHIALDALLSCKLWQDVREYGPSLWHKTYSEDKVAAALQAIRGVLES